MVVLHTPIMPKGTAWYIKHRPGKKPIVREYLRGQVPRMKPLVHHRQSLPRSARGRIISFFHTTEPGVIIQQKAKIRQYIEQHGRGREAGIRELSRFLGGFSVEVAPVALEMGMDSKTIWQAIDAGRKIKLK